MKKYLLLSSLMILLFLCACSNMKQADEIPKTPVTTANTVTVEGGAGIDASATDQAAAPVAEPDAEPLADPEMETEIFIEIPDIHGIIFDNQGNMFICRKGNEILKVTPDANVNAFTSLDRLKDKTEKTNIYSMALGKDNIMYAAACDRIIKITPDGDMETLIEEDFTGQWGACDVKIDHEGNIYVVHGVKVEKYSGSLHKTLLIDGEKDKIKLSAAVGIDFDKDYKNLYLGDVFGKKIVKYPLDSGDSVREPLVLDLVYKNPEYVTVSERNEAFVSLPGGGGLAKVGTDGEVTVLCEDILKEPFTLAFGGKGFDEKSLYVVSQGKVYRVNVGYEGTH